MWEGGEAGMTLEAGKEMDRKCVYDWLNEVYTDPSLSYCRYTDEKIRIFAHDALGLLKEQEPALPTWSQGKAYCGKCGQKLPRKRENKEINFCGCCGQAVKWK